LITIGAGTTASIPEQLTGGADAPTEFQDLKSNTCDAILAALLLLGLPALIASFLRANEFSQIWSVITQCVALTSMGLVLALRKRISFLSRALALLGSIYLLGVVGWVSYGHIGGGKLFLLVFILLTAIFFGFRASFIAIFISMVTLAVIGYMYVSGAVGTEIIANQYHKAISPWVTAAFTVVLFGGFISSGIAMLLRSQAQTLKLLRERSLFLDTVIEQSNALFLILDLDLRLQNCNERVTNTFNIDAIRSEGKSLQTMLEGGTGSSRLLTAMANAIETQISTHIEVQHVVGGEIINLVWDITPLRSETEEMIGLICFAQDITELRQAQRQLDHQTRLTAMGEMTTSIAHEINQPLSVIRLVVGGLSRTIEKAIDRSSSIDLEKARAKLERVDDHVDRAATITNHMRQFGTDHQGSKEEFALGEALSNIVTLKNATYDLLGIELQVDESVSDIYVIGRKPELEQVFLIVLSNAETAVKELEDSEGKRISIEVNLDNGTCNVLVKDSAKGIAESDLVHVFDPFFSTRETGEGTGLGLSVARKLMHEMDGSIELYNSQTGGACAHMRLQAAHGANEVQLATET